MKDFQKRVVNQKTELDFEIEYITDFISTSIMFASQDSGEQKRIERQREVMIEYSEILEARVSSFG